MISIDHADLVTHLPTRVAERLGHYVYLYVDPRTDRPFYVGKGKGDRILTHLHSTRDSEKTRIIAEATVCGHCPSCRTEVLKCNS